ncbi:hypothetical protein FKM82_006428 [Ascaphus truei]
MLFYTRRLLLIYCTLMSFDRSTFFTGNLSLLAEQYTATGTECQYKAVNKVLCKMMQNHYYCILPVKQNKLFAYIQYQLLPLMSSP